MSSLTCSMSYVHIMSLLELYNRSIIQVKNIKENEYRQYIQVQNSGKFHLENESSSIDQKISMGWSADH